jgi:predicted O-methyltransferase YrrM
MRIGIFSATHPVTGDQLVTRDPSEPSELGYEEPLLLGYALAVAPVTGDVSRPAAGVPWGSRFGEALTGSQDPCRERRAEPEDLAAANDNDSILLYPLGHFYSPIYDPSDIQGRRQTIWPKSPRPTVGIAWHEDAQLGLCRSVFARQEPLQFRTDPSGDPTEYWAGNDQYPLLDASVLAAILRHHSPRRMIETGSGYSSLVTARVNREYLNRSMHFTCIEPFPRQFLIDGIDGISALRVELVQDTPLTIFEQLEEDDCLFIDTSHTVKTGGDVTWLFHEIVPRLRRGVLVHIHDVFLPGEYPESWVLEGRGWNETYLVRSFLTFNETFRVVWGTQFMIQKQPNELARAFPSAELAPHAGASLWLQRNR